jgi:hypothetical protein
MEMAYKRISSREIWGRSCGRETTTAAIRRDYSHEASDWLVGNRQRRFLSHKFRR